MSVNGIEVVEDNTDEVISALDAAIMRALEAIGKEAEGDAVDYIEEFDIIDTGRLHTSITHAIDADEKAAIVGTNVEYALYVHEGTSRVGGRPFLVAPIQANAGKYSGIAEAALKNA